MNQSTKKAGVGSGQVYSSALGFSSFFSSLDFFKRAPINLTSLRAALRAPYPLAAFNSCTYIHTNNQVMRIQWEVGRKYLLRQ